MHLFKNILSQIRSKTTKGKQDKTDTTENADELSSCASLPLILSFLDFDDVTSCLALNRRINSVTTNCLDKLQKKSAKITIWNTYSKEDTSLVGIKALSSKTGKYSKKGVWYLPFHINNPHCTERMYICNRRLIRFVLWFNPFLTWFNPLEHALTFRTIVRRSHIEELKMMSNPNEEEVQHLVECFRTNLRSQVDKLEFDMDEAIEQSCLDIAEFSGGKCDFVIDRISDTADQLKLLRFDDVTVRIQQRLWDEWDKSFIVDMLQKWQLGGPTIKSLRLASIESSDGDGYIVEFNQMCNAVNGTRLNPAKMSRNFRLRRENGGDGEEKRFEFLKVSFFHLCCAVSITSVNADDTCADCSTAISSCDCKY